MIEKDAVELHLVAMSSRQPTFYWQAGTLAVLEGAQRLRESGVEVYCTIDAGPNVHLICPPEVEEVVATTILELEHVDYVIRDRVGGPPTLEERHLF